MDKLNLDVVKEDNFLKEIELDRDWRVKEFASIKKNYLKQKNGDFKNVYLKMVIPILYAHWEGFCVSTFKNILRYINSENLKYNQLTNNLFTYAQTKTYDYLKGKQSFEQRCNFTKDFIEIIDKFITLNTKVNTKSNLKYEVFEEVCTIIGLATDTFKEYGRDLDKLVHIRNAIAHGENSIKLDFNNVTNNIALITTLMDLLILEASKYITQKKYIVEDELKHL